jgi:hypothetical protein
LLDFRLSGGQQALTFQFCVCLGLVQNLGTPFVGQIDDLTRLGLGLVQQVLGFTLGQILLMMAPFCLG